MLTSAPVSPDTPPGPITENAALQTPIDDPNSISAPPQHETRNSESETAPSSATTAFSARLPRGKRDRWTPFKGARARSTVFTPQLVTEIFETIERFGFTETEAAIHWHVSTSTLNRWKQEDPEFEDFL